MIVRFQPLWACAVVVGLICTPHASSSAPAGPQPGASRAVHPVPVGPRGTEVARVKQLVARIGTCKSMGELSQMFSNETSAYMGLMMGLAIGMVSSMAESFAKMGEEMAKQSGGEAPKQDPKQAAEMRQMRQVASSLESLFKRYGLDQTMKADPASKGQLPTSLRAKGRQFLGEVAVLMDSLPSNGRDGGIQLNRSKMPPHPDKLRYRVVSPTRVLIHNPKQPKERIEARAEEGAWRLHIADIQQQLSSSMRASGQGKASGSAAPQKP